MISKRKIQQAAAIAILDELLDILVWDEELQRYVLPEGSIMAADKEVVELAFGFIGRAYEQPALKTDDTDIRNLY